VLHTQGQNGESAWAVMADCNQERCERIFDLTSKGLVTGERDLPSVGRVIITTGWALSVCTQVLLATS
jgi:hypothetical protein